MNEVQAPECPRCADGGNVRLIDEQEDSGIFKPLPARPPRTLVFQCACGWATTVRLRPLLDDRQNEMTACRLVAS
jgi:hypothetical protein